MIDLDATRRTRVNRLRVLSERWAWRRLQQLMQAEEVADEVVPVAMRPVGRERECECGAVS